MNAIVRASYWVDRNGFRAYGRLSLIIFFLVVYATWGSIFGHQKLPDPHVAQYLIAIAFASALFNIGVNLGKIAKRIPQLNHGYFYAWSRWFLLAIAFGVFFVWALPYTLESFLVGGIFIFHVLPKLVYVYTRNRLGAMWVAERAREYDGTQMDEDTATKEWKSLLKDAKIPSVFIPSPIAAIAIPLALLVIFNA